MCVTISTGHLDVFEAIHHMTAEGYLGTLEFVHLPQTIDQSGRGIVLGVLDEVHCD